MLTKAIIKDDRILCGRCFNRLIDIVEKPKDKAGVKLKVMCKARRNGINCNEINEIQL